jgi:hypothetical protein
MEVTRLRKLLTRLRKGEVSVNAALRELKLLPFEDLGWAKVDHHRALRKGFGEVVFCQSKTPEQVGQVFKALARDGATVLGTRASPEAFAAVVAQGVKATYHEQARAIVANPPKKAARRGPVVLVVSAGTADQPVAEEAALTAELLGAHVQRLYDVGVAGIHRLLAHREEVESAKAVIVVAGMEGALASVVGGLVDKPVIAVPTSVGYGANFGGLSALLAMLNACAPGIVVVNIDNGFGAGFFAALICRQTRQT